MPTATTSQHIGRLTHKRLNDWLTALIVLLALYIGLAPFGAQFTWWLKHRKDAPVKPTTISAQVKTQHNAHQLISAEQTLRIPRLGLKEVIHTGLSQSELNKGTWLVPHTSTPAAASNTVIIGHRFTYAGPAVFYFLDKVERGDKIILTWDRKEYTYIVESTRVVPPTEVSVTNPSTRPQLTLYTCTPLWTAKNRLVITAPLQEVRT